MFTVFSCLNGGAEDSSRFISLSVSYPVSSNSSSEANSGFHSLLALTIDARIPRVCRRDI